MPVSIRTRVELRVPQARVLHALMPADQRAPPFDWPLLCKAILGVRAGYTAISGSITRALNGIRPGSSSGNTQLGLMALGFVEAEEVDVDGVVEACYRITEAGVSAFEAFFARNGGKLPPLKDAAVHVNTNRGYNNPHIRETG